MRILTLFCLSFFSLISLGASIPADMSFIVIDLKYNQNDGVKVCEIQQGLGCVFYGVEHIEGKKNAFGEIFCDYLFPYFQRNWYVRPRISPEITSILKKNSNWTRLFSFDEVVTKQEIKKYAQTKVKDPSSLSSYHGLVISHYKLISESALKKVKGLIVMNRAFLPIFGSELFSDKRLMSELFDKDERLRKIKPKWKSYNKGYSEELIEQINQDFPGDIIVIKPRVGLQGRGIAIIRKEELPAILEYVFSGVTELADDPDPTYNWWAQDSFSDFIVEEFIESDPILAPHLSDDYYDGTMRVPVILTYDRGEIQVHCLYMWWKLPTRTLSEECSLTDKHKSYSLRVDNHMFVEDEIKEKVKDQLVEALPALYEQLL